ncbi:hypothetical protein NQ314_008042 [Rhamnusium bicolor]|uniref:Transposase n=1 Tax=Rhamnusium bicolor TaxID=1586634 RepID=A0AAV8YE95_9CUCU|nr:hypothetical protein NQ314_008042 [Rhamnusium bicolor]
MKTPFTNNIPGNEWFYNFKNRHRLSIKKPQAVEFSRRKMTDPFVIYEYFDLLNKTLSDLNLHDKPELIWNLDETSLSEDSHKTRAVGETGKPSSRTTSGPGRENTTVLSAVSASDLKAPPLIIFKGKNIWDSWLPDVEKVLYWNFLCSHSHLLQPLDLSVFKSVKDRWDLKLVTRQRKNIGHKIPKKVFSELIGETWKDLNTEIIRNSFKKAGIHPFNRHQQALTNETNAINDIIQENTIENDQTLDTAGPPTEPVASQVSFGELLLNTMKQTQRDEHLIKRKSCRRCRSNNPPRGIGKAVKRKRGKRQREE